MTFWRDDDLHFITDKDVRKGPSFAVKIGAVTDAARPLAMGRKEISS